MNITPQSMDATRWQNLRRRWSLVLGVLLTINGAMVLFAVAGGSTNHNVIPPAGRTTNEPPVASNTSPSRPLTSPSPLSAGADGSSSIPSGKAERMQAAAVSERESPAPATEEQQAPTLASEIVLPSRDNHAAAADVEPNYPLLPIDPSSLILVNKPGNGGGVHFILDGTAYSLASGEAVEVDGGATRLLVFHRGDELDDCQRMIGAGIFVFHVDVAGWQLEACQVGERADILRDCRRIEPR